MKNVTIPSIAIDDESSKFVRFEGDPLLGDNSENLTTINKNHQPTPNGNSSFKGPKNIGKRIVGSGSERFSFSLGDSSKGLETGSVRLHRKRRLGFDLLSLSSLDDQDASIIGNELEHKQSGFVDGNFSSGKILDLVVERCYVMAYQRTHNIWRSNYMNMENDTVNNLMPSYLAVGTVKGVSIYETAGYSLAYKIRRSGMVSAIHWADSPKISPFNANDSEICMSNVSNQYSLLVVGSLDGTVSLYVIDSHILESQGPTLIHEFSVKDQVRALDCCFFGKLFPLTFLICVGDKSGDLTFCSLRYNGLNFAASPLNMEHLSTTSVQNYTSGVLGISISHTGGLLATSTKGGHVFVYKLHRNHSGIVYIEKNVWEVERNGPIRCVLFTHDASQLCYGGYEKEVVFVDTEFWAISRQLQLDGTINTMSFDPRGRYFGVGCRDKSLSLFDTSTFVKVKEFHVSGWVTSISWAPQKIAGNSTFSNGEVVAFRSDNKCISILDLTPTSLTTVRLSSRHGQESSISWSLDGTLIARASGSIIIVADALDRFRDVLSVKVGGLVTQVRFCHVDNKDNQLAAIDESGVLTILQVGFQPSGDLATDLMRSVFVAPGLKALAWSNDGQMIATGGKDKFLYLYEYESLETKVDPIKLEGRIWDIDFIPEQTRQSANSTLLLGVALGDYTAMIFNDAFEPALRIVRSRTCRCISFNPVHQVVAVGDGAGIVTIVDYDSEEMLKELDVKGRVNVVKYSPAGDFLVVGSDDARFTIYESSGYQCLQEIDSQGFALSVSLSPNGMCLALGGANESYRIVRLGPFLGIDLIPLALDGGLEEIPSWALKEALFRSWDGPSLIQRYMIKGGQDNLTRVAAILRDYPSAVYTFDRRTNEGAFATAINQKKPNLLKLAITTLVDGTLAPKTGEEKNFLTTDIPQQGKLILADIVRNYPANFAVDIFKEIAFMKVPFTSPKECENGRRLEIGSSSYTDPWREEHQTVRTLQRTTAAASLILGDKSRDFVTRTPAVLPLPGLGEMEFLASLLMFAPLEVFENEAMAVVVRVVWYEHIRKYFILDCILFAAYYVCWIALVELTFSSDDAYNFDEKPWVTLIAVATAIFNTIFAAKELTQSRLGRRAMYFRSMSNAVDVSSILCVYLYILTVFIEMMQYDESVTLAVATTLLLTTKALAYLRGFRETGWLISVLTANFRDVRGFLIILATILIGFSLSFRVLYGDESYSFGTLRRSLLSTFQMTITSQYDPAIINDTTNNVVAVLTFVLAVTCVLVVALNALISILADSYARVQQNAVANRRREVAALIVEYMSLLPPSKRHEIERQTKWFHTQLEVDPDGSLHMQTADWEGGLNALRRDMQSLHESTVETTNKVINEMKTELDLELVKFKKEVVSLLEDMHDDLKFLRRAQAQGIKLDGRNVVKAVQTIQAVGQKVGQQGGALLKMAEGHAVKSLGQVRGKAISTFTRS